MYRHLLDVPDYESDSESDFSVCTKPGLTAVANVSTQTPTAQAISAVTPSPCMYTRRDEDV